MILARYSKLSSSGFTVPGLAVWQATHLASCALFCTMQVSHSHDPSGFLNFSPKLSSPPDEEEVVVAAAASGVPAAVVVAEDEKDEEEGVEREDGRVRPGLTPVPGLAVSQATHLSASGLFCTRQVSHSQVPAGGANRDARPGPELADTDTAGGLLSNLEEEEEEDESFWGLEVWQATHLESAATFCTMHVSQLQEPDAGLNLSPKPERGRAGAGVEEEEGVEVGVLEAKPAEGVRLFIQLCLQSK